MVSVVTNIDADHMATYNNDFNELRRAFLEFLHRLPFYGLAVLCIDDPVVRELLPEISRPFFTYGFSLDADFRATNIRQVGTTTYFTVERPNKMNSIDIVLNLPGKHNVLNALAAIAIASELKIADGAIQSALEKFAGIGRRFQISNDLPLKKGGKVTLIDDYGHHPREIAVTIDAVRHSWPEKRLVMVFQPHRYTRTRNLFADFCEVLSQPDALVLLDIYSAGEAVIEGADGATLIKKISERGMMQPVFAEKHEKLADILQEILCDGDVLLMQGAGNIGALASHLAATQLCESVAKTTVSGEAH